jgi:Reverse transcriptase (RNA-dependent DNA polymerase)
MEVNDLPVYCKTLMFLGAPYMFWIPSFKFLIRKSLYGLVQAPKTFYNYLTGNLKKHGFTSQAFIDPCLWINRAQGIICVIWVDDSLFFAKTTKVIQTFIDNIKKDMPLTQELSVSAFLGIQVSRTKDHYELT